MRHAPEFHCKLDGDNWSDADLVMGCWTHEQAALCFAEDKYRADEIDVFVVDVRPTKNRADVKQFRVTAQQVVEFTAEEVARQGKGDREGKLEDSFDR